VCLALVEAFQSLGMVGGVSQLGEPNVLQHQHVVFKALQKSRQVLEPGRQVTTSRTTASCRRLSLIHGCAACPHLQLLARLQLELQAAQALHHRRRPASKKDRKAMGGGGAGG
jgi:hypothetical protein